MMFSKRMYVKYVLDLAILFAETAEHTYFFKGHAILFWGRECAP